MKLHYVLFVSLFIAGAWITNYKASHTKISHQKSDGRVPASTVLQGK